MIQNLITIGDIIRICQGNSLGTYASPINDIEIRCPAGWAIHIPISIARKMGADTFDFEVLDMQFSRSYIYAIVLLIDDSDFKEVQLLSQRRY